MKRTDSPWGNMLWAGGYDFQTPPPLVTEGAITPSAGSC
jgi:hypothetical protein